MKQLKSLLLLLALALLASRGWAQTLIHYTLNATDASTVAVGVVPNAGTLGNGIVSNSVTLSSDIPTNGVPPGAGNRSFSGGGSGGVLSPGTLQLNRTNIANAGGFTYETWFKWNGGGNINAIIDYAGTEKLVRKTTDSFAGMEVNAGGDYPVGPANSNQWHYAAAVFTAISSNLSSDSVTGNFAFYLDTNALTGTMSNITITSFGDTLNRTIGVAMHPAAFASDYFNGLVYEPRVTLGALPSYSLLFKPGIVVTTNADSGPGSLRNAVSNAPSGAAITFAPALSGHAILLTNGLILLGNNVTIDASALPGGMEIIGNNSSRIFRVNSGVTAVLNSLTLTNGIDIDDEYVGGGAIFNGGTLTVNNCVLTGNRSTSGDGGGGGIFNQGNLTVNNSTFATNQASPSLGGGIMNSSGSTTVSNCLFTGNLASESEGGGGIFNEGTLKVNYSTFATNAANNSEDGGGGILNSGGSTTVSNCVFTGNLANGSGYGGGGIFNGATLSVFDSTFTSNQANNVEYGGGGICDLGGSLALFNCTIVGNQANNNSSGGGGGIFGEDATLTVNNCTIVLNQATNGQGGGIYNGFGTVYLTNSIVCSNTTPPGTNIFGNVTPASSPNNLVDANPMLAPLGNYGGPTPTMRPLAGSPAIDAGTDSVTSILATDQRGYPRKSGAHVDIGAVELYTNEAYIVLNNLDNGPGSLRQTAFYAPSGSAITFATNLSGQTIGLTSGQIVLNSNVTVDAMTLTNGLQINGNNASRIFSISSGATVALRGLSLTGGNAGAGNPGGGAIVNFGLLQILGCTFADNQATNDSGGAIDNEDTCTLQNCTLTGNFAAEVGGALYNNGPCKLIHCTITLNTAVVGGGGFANNNLATLAMTNCIVAGNTGSPQDDIYNFDLSTITAGGTNIVLSWVNNGTFIGTNSILVKAPQLSPLANCGGPTQTMPPLPGSPAINAGGATSVTNDQRGFPRPVDAPDIGAVELQTLFVVVTTNSDDATPGTLRNVIANADWSSTVSFANSLSGQTILLTNGQIVLAKPVVIDGSALASPVVIDGNNASGIFEVNGGVNAVLTGLTLANGNALIGGAALNNGTLSVNQCTLAGNTANCGCGFGGGAIANNSLLTISNSTFTGNSGSFGGALFNNLDSTMNIIQCTFTGNLGTNGGGAIYNYFGTSLTLNQSTVVGNYSTSSGSEGGGIANGGGPFYLTNTIVCSNTAASSPNTEGVLTPVSSTNNLVDVNALLYPLGNYGGPTQTMPPLPGSPAINGGAATSLTTDQRGFPRAAGAQDIGAVELQSLSAVVTTNSDDASPGTLRNVIANADWSSTVSFANSLSGQTIQLTNGQIVLAKGMIIDGSALASPVHINGNHTSGIFGVNGGVNAVLTGLTLTNGNALIGGAVLNNGTLLVNKCTLAGNTANCGCGIGGGAIANNSLLTVSNSTLTGNSGSYGGALFNNTDSTMDIIQCTFTGNLGTNGGGAIYNFGASLTLNQSTVVGNFSTSGGSEGGGIANGGGPFYLTNTIVCSNTAASSPNIGGVTIPLSSTNNLVDVNALLHPLGSYGGPTQTMPPLPGSPAINAGAATGLTTDQRGFPRPVGAQDGGAVEGVYNPAGPGTLKNVKKLGNGSVEFGFTNYSGMPYTVLASTNAAFPLDLWSDLGAAVESPVGSGQFQFTDPQATNYARRFYRVEGP